jgi:hypothetical protein
VPPLAELLPTFLAVKQVWAFTYAADQARRGAAVLELPTGERRALMDWHVRDVGTGAIEKFRAARRTQAIVTATDQDGRRRARRKGGVLATNRDLALIRAMFNWAIRLDYVDTTPFKKSTETVVKLSKETARRRRLEGDEGAATPAGLRSAGV